MKGVNKCVVEIVEPQDESIERVLVFFKPESRAVQLGCQQDAAEKYVSGLVSWRRSILPLGPGARAALWAAATRQNAAYLFPVLSILGAVPYAGMGVGFLKMQVATSPSATRSMYFSSTHCSTGLQLCWARCCALRSSACWRPTRPTHCAASFLWAWQALLLPQ